MNEVYETINRQDLGNMDESIKSILSPYVAKLKESFTPLISEEDRDALLYGFIVFFKGKMWAFSPEYIKDTIDFRMDLEEGRVSEDVVLTELTKNPEDHMENGEKLLLSVYAAVTTGLIAPTLQASVFYVEGVKDKTYLCQLRSMKRTPQQH